MLVSVNVGNRTTPPETVGMVAAKSRSNSRAVTPLPLAKLYAPDDLGDPDPVSVNGSGPLPAISVNDLCIIDPNLLIRNLVDSDIDDNSNTTIMLDSFCRRSLA
jgi:hypothetical protein